MNRLGLPFAKLLTLLYTKDEVSLDIMTHSRSNALTKFTISDVTSLLFTFSVRLPRRRRRPASERERVRDGLVAEGANQGEAADTDGAFRRHLGRGGQGLLGQLQVHLVCSQPLSNDLIFDHCSNGVTHQVGENLQLTLI